MSDRNIPVLFSSDATAGGEQVVQSLNLSSDQDFNFFSCSEIEVTYPCLLIFNQSDDSGQSLAEVGVDTGELLSRLVSTNESRAVGETGKPLQIVPVFVGVSRLETSTALHQLVKTHKEFLQTPAIMLRDRHWVHDIGLLQARIQSWNPAVSAAGKPTEVINKYPVARILGKDRPKPATIEEKLGNQGEGWSLRQSGATATDSDGSTLEQTELVREFVFKSFAQALDYMDCVAQGCDIADHHPGWTNSYKKLRISLSTWDAAIPHVTERDVMLAAYFEHVYSDYQ